MRGPTDGHRLCAAGPASAPFDGSGVLRFKQKSPPDLEVWVLNLFWNKAEPVSLGLWVLGFTWP